MSVENYISLVVKHKMIFGVFEGGEYHGKIL